MVEGVLRIEPDEARALALAALAAPSSGNVDAYQALLSVVRAHGVQAGASLLCGAMSTQSAVACLVLMCADLADRAASGGA